MRTLRFLVLVALAAFGLPLLFASPAAAATITVTTTVDGTPNGAGAPVSLREAISSAGNNAGPETIVLAAGATYELDSCGGGAEELDNIGGDLNYFAPDALTVQGNGATIVQGCPGERVMRLTTAGSALLKVQDVTLTSGESDQGGGLYLSGNGHLEGVDVTGNTGTGPGDEGEGVIQFGDTRSLDLIDVDISGNEGLGVRAYAVDMSIEGSRFEDNGFGAVQAGQYGLQMLVTDSVFARNNLDEGSVSGGITANEADLTIRGSTFVGNFGLNGGAIRHADGTTRVEDSTISGNTGTIGGGIYDGDFDAIPANNAIELEHVTIFGNTDAGGPNNIEADGTLTAFASVIGQAGAADSCDIVGATTSQGYNVDRGDSCGFGAGPGDGENVQLRLGGLTAGNDPLEQVRVPGFLSPAVDRIPIGSCTGSIIDQTSNLRLDDGDFDGVAECDSGAVEREPLAVFNDVPEGHTFFDEIGWMAWEEISTGFQPGPQYKPGANVTRQAMSAFLYRLAGEPAYSPGAPSFSDVPASSTFFTEIEWMNDAGITTGFPGGLFKPDAAVTRQSMSAFMHRMAGEPPGPFPDPGFTDVGPSNPFFLAISWMADAEVTTGFGDNTYRPGDDVTRQAMSAFMFRLAPLLP
jgi:hypothetical protein